MGVRGAGGAKPTFGVGRQLALQSAGGVPFRLFAKAPGGGSIPKALYLYEEFVEPYYKTGPPPPRGTPSRPFNATLSEREMKREGLLGRGKEGGCACVCVCERVVVLCDVAVLFSNGAFLVTPPGCLFVMTALSVLHCPGLISSVHSHWAGRM